MVLAYVPDAIVWPAASDAVIVRFWVAGAPGVEPPAANPAGTLVTATAFGMPIKVMLCALFVPTLGVNVSVPVSSAVPLPLVLANVWIVNVLETPGGDGGPLTVHGHGTSAVRSVVLKNGVTVGCVVRLIVIEFAAGDTRCGARPFADDVRGGMLMVNVGVTRSPCGAVVAWTGGLRFAAAVDPPPPPQPASAVRATRARILRMSICSCGCMCCHPRFGVCRERGGSLTVLGGNHRLRCFELTPNDDAV